MKFNNLPIQYLTRNARLTAFASTLAVGADVFAIFHARWAGDATIKGAPKIFQPNKVLNNDELS